MVVNIVSHAIITNNTIITIITNVIIITIIMIRWAVVNIVAHELAHQWTGNLVTLTWFDQIDIVKH